MRLFLLISVIFYTGISFGQSSAGIYDFSNIPQTNLLNPAYKTYNKGHVALPMLGNHQVFGGSSGVVLDDVFANNQVSIEEKLKTSIYNMSDKDVFLVRQTSEIINIGYHYKDYNLSFGIYEELNVFSNFPKSLSEFFYEGTSNLGKKYSIDGYSMQSNALAVYHIGVQKKLNNKTSIGLRFKLYNEAFDARSSGNSGIISVQSGEDNIYKYELSHAKVQTHTSGVVLDSYDFTDKSYIINKLFFSGNKGLGLDIGFTKNINEKWDFSTSLLDLGFIVHTHDVKNYSAQGDFSTEGIELIFDETNPTEYWTSLENDFKESLHYKETEKAYLALRHIQWNAMIKYKINKRRLAECSYTQTNKREFDYQIAMGGYTSVQLYNGVVFPSVSAFYERNFSNFLQMRAHYTVNRFSYTNIGITSSFHIWKLNLFASVDNIIGLTNLAKTNSVSAQFGLNVVF